MAETWILLLRGVNVGGNNRLPMADFRIYLQELGLSAVQTYIQSGNAVFAGASAQMQGAIAAGMAARFGFSPRMFFYTLPAYLAILAANPFAREGAAQGKSVHLFFLASPFAGEDAAALTALAAQDERVVFTPSAAYLHAPSGIGRSRLAEKLGQTRKLDLTARNFTTCAAIAELAQATVPR